MLSELLKSLAEFRPLIAGTFPLGIHTDSSDLDVLCEVHDFAHFTSVARQEFGHLHGFEVHAPTIRFTWHGTQVELFGQAMSVFEQHAFRHLIVEGRLLRLGGEALRERVLALKRAGVKTEPAFARVLRLPGDAYEALLALESASDERLRALIELE